MGTPVHSLTEMRRRGWGIEHEPDGAVKLVPGAEDSPVDVDELERRGYMAIEEHGTYRLLEPEAARKAVAKNLELHFLGVPVSVLLVLTFILILYQVTCER